MHLSDNGFGTTYPIQNILCRMMWFRIKAYERDIGRNITFWLWGDGEEHVRDILSQRDGITDIQYIEQDKPSFID